MSSKKHRIEGAPLTIYALGIWTNYHVNIYQPSIFRQVFVDSN